MRQPRPHRDERGGMRRVLFFRMQPVDRIALALAVSVLLALTVTHTGVDASLGRVEHTNAGVSFTPVRPTFSRHIASYPLKVSANRRYLTDRHGAPFLLVGDSPQALVVNLSEVQARTYFANRRAAGFNAVWVNLLCSTYTGGRENGSTYDGTLPFTKPGDLSTPNPVYFKRVDDMVRLAAAYNFVVFLDPIETGGWLPILRNNGVAQDYAYGQYLGHRYGKFPNIVWMSGNDFQTWNASGDTAVVKAVMQGLQDSTPHTLQTIELNYYSSGSIDNAALRPLLGLDAAYTYYPTYAQVLSEYDRAHMPVFMVEAHYDGENVGGELGTPEVLRRQEYWTMLSGAAGQFYGSQYWNLHDGWQQHLDTTGTNELAYLLDLFAPRRWYDLVPDQRHVLVTDGVGTYSRTGNVSASDYVTAARTPDDRLAIAYLPTWRTITLDLSKLKAPVRARWYDPTRGTFIEIRGTPFTRGGVRKFSPPHENGAGEGDWVLVLETARKH